MNVKLGQQVGYTIRFEDVTSNQTKIKYMTDGILLREALHSNFLNKYSCIIIDEAHERTLNTDILFGILKQSLQVQANHLKLIITSATLNANKFSQFFNNAPIYKIPGRNYAVNIIYSRFNCIDYLDSVINHIIQIHLSTSIDDGDILTFLTGQEDIEACCILLYQRLIKIGINTIPSLIILPIYSQLSSKLQAKIFNTYPHSRKCIIATNS